MDLGASSGRVVLGHVESGKLVTRTVTRFANDPVALPDGLHWDVTSLYRNVVAALAAAERAAPGDLISAGIDTWGVDYGIVRDARLRGIPHHYRDDRTARVIAPVHAAVSAEDLYRRNGLQHLPFTTLYQLAAEAEDLGGADRMLFVPDLLCFWLTGRQATEETIASTSGLLDVTTRTWDEDLLRRLQLPVSLVSDLVQAGTTIGSVAGAPSSVIGRPLDIVAVGAHDTASAIVAVPNVGRDFAYVSCGTWGLVGLELDAPVISADAREVGFSNEAGVDGRTTFHRNVMGLWLLSESLRYWEPDAGDAERSSLLHQLLQRAAEVPSGQPVFDVDDTVFLRPGDVPGRIVAWLEDRGLRPPSGRVETVRCIVESIAAGFAEALGAALDLVPTHRVDVVHVIGGGALNELLCQSLADRTGLVVIAGPVEATAIGNIAVQARAAGLLEGGLTALRSVVARSCSTRLHRPRGASAGAVGRGRASAPGGSSTGYPQEGRS
ncbi:rhamnulokinase family protein [Curtobacterium sp. BRB10]|uniref:rhamnulokinase n=1 Tax=Curtobacterium sp. BRB10 TaxID=2962579 RepID=UPI0028821248|nr:rhamnulokinase family protein [Curtobacterium sp. BRB10]MDT0234849.1 rhamnulokinase family protein [Curtobacterium sp. BRB10]